MPTIATPEKGLVLCHVYVRLIVHLCSHDAPIMHTVRAICQGISFDNNRRHHDCLPRINGISG